jgi:L-aspartate oxidase
MTEPLRFDVLILGSGLAGLTVALSLADQCRVAVVTKRRLIDGSSDWAQGGIAAVLDRNEDDFDSHVQDTLIAGAGLCKPDVVRHIVEHAPDSIHWLIDKGVPFTTDRDNPSGYHLTREGGHSHRRIIHAADATGHAVQTTLEARVRAHPNIQLFESHSAIDLITHKTLGQSEARVYGAYVFDNASATVQVFAAQHTVLATGGAGKVYLYTSNPDTATGDGIAMAWRAGCRVSNMEFIQFHPTCLFHPQAKTFLISEAVRGEGGQLKLPDDARFQGRRFMPEYDAREELAPRDIVARAIDAEMKKRGLDCVYLDISHRPAEFIQEHFPNIYAHCLKFGIDMTREPIPVVPAAHYTCGGVVTDLNARTDLPGLYAVGETACTGLHGANRLASNSLLECVVLGRNAAQQILQQPRIEVPRLPAWDESRVTQADEEVTIAHDWDEIRRLMWNYVGIVRSTTRLHQAERRIKLLNEEIQSFYARYRISTDLLELRNLVVVADLIVQCALARHESRGLHATRDYPGMFDEAKDTMLSRTS